MVLFNYENVDVIRNVCHLLEHQSCLKSALDLASISPPNGLHYGLESASGRQLDHYQRPT